MTDATTSMRPDIALGYDSVPEIPDQISLPVSGTLPPYLGSSTLYRVGPGNYEAKHSDGKPFHIEHWFDGLSLLHAFRIDAANNAVNYQSRFLTRSLERAIGSVPRKKWNDISFGSPDPCRAFLGKLFQLFTRGSSPVDPLTGKPFVPNVGVTVQTLPGKGLVTRTDYSATIKFDEETLEVEHFFNLNEEYGVHGSMSASHGHYDSDTDEYFNYSYEFGPPGPTDYTVFRVKSDGKPEMLAKIKHDPCYLHSFATTKNYVILIFCPVVMPGLPILFNGAVTGGMNFDANKPTRFAVVARDGRGVVAEYESEAFFAFHTINAYESDEDDSIVIDLSRYDDAKFIKELTLTNLRSGASLSSSTLSRYTLPNLSTAVPPKDEKYVSARTKAERTVIEAHDMELARVAGTNLRSKHRFVYGVSSDDPTKPFSRIAKVDVTDGSRITWGEGLRMVVGEPIFVPDPTGSAEDDGCLLVVALDAARGKSRMMVLDARDLSEIGSAEVPQVVPLGFHGNHRSN